MSAKPIKEKSKINFLQNESLKNETNKPKEYVNNSPGKNLQLNSPIIINPKLLISHKKNLSTQIKNKLTLLAPLKQINEQSSNSIGKHSPKKVIYTSNFQTITEISNLNSNIVNLNFNANINKFAISKVNKLPSSIKEKISPMSESNTKTKSIFTKPLCTEYIFSKLTKNSTNLNIKKANTIVSNSKQTFKAVETKFINLKIVPHKININNSKTKEKFKDGGFSPKDNFFININYLKTEPDLSSTFKYPLSNPLSIPISKFSTPKYEFSKKIIIKKEDALANMVNPFSPLKSSKVSRFKKTNTNSQDFIYRNSSLDKNVILTRYEKCFTKNEIIEIKALEEIYFLGNVQNEIGYSNSPYKSYTSIMSKKYKFSRPSSRNNSTLTEENLPVGNINKEAEYDDENGNYIVKIGDHINYRYEILSELGRGSFGQAVKCYDHKTKERLCVKIIKNKNKFYKQAKIEIQILEFIKNNDTGIEKQQSNVVKIIEHFIFRNHICIVFELLDINLYELIKNQDFKGLEMPMIRKLSIQMLHSLIFLQKHKIIHCDLKPENILLKQYGETGIKIIDFGSSCFDNEKLYTYIQSRFYRAPEIILGLSYDCGIDMWSFGCIIVELFTGTPIFPGENERDQLGYIMEYLGVPSAEFLNKSKKRTQFFEINNSPILIPNSKGKIRHPNTKNISNFLKGADEAFLDLIEKCLELDPSKRIKPVQALLHPWIGMNKETNQFYKENEDVIDRMPQCHQYPQYAFTESSKSNSDLTYSTKARKAGISKIKNVVSNSNIHHDTLSKDKLHEIGNYANFKTGIKIGTTSTKIKTQILKSNKSDVNNYTSLKPKINLTLDVNINFEKLKKINEESLIHTSSNKSTRKFSFV